MLTNFFLFVKFKLECSHKECERKKGGGKWQLRRKKQQRKKQQRKKQQRKRKNSFHISMKIKKSPLV